jgi:AraC-like DNA-binding protein
VRGLVFRAPYADRGRGFARTVRPASYPDHVTSPSADRLLTPGYREWLPPAELRHALACYWVAVVPPDGGPRPANVLPDLCSDLIWQSGRGAFVAGPDTGPAPELTPPGTFLVGARFLPGAGGPALGLPLAHLRDQRVDVAAISPVLAAPLGPDLLPRQAVEAITQLAARLVTEHPPDQLVVHAGRLLAAGRASVAGLAAAVCVSDRQLRRRFDEAVGYGPKVTERVLRFRRVLWQLSAATDELNLASLAIETGYADQAHLTRETTRLSGLPPGALARTLSRPAQHAERIG